MAAKRTPLAAPAPREPESPLPVVESIGLAKVPRGWVVVAISVQGDKVVAREVVSKDPEPKAHAARRAMQEIVKAFMLPKNGVDA